LNRLELITYPDTSTVGYVYDEAGNRTSMTDGQGTLGTVTYVYDPNGRLEYVTDHYGRVVSYDYDEVGNRTLITYPGNRDVVYVYDALDRLTTVTDWSSGTASYTYTPEGDLNTVTYPNGTVENLDYDTARRLVDLVHEDNLGGTIASYGITLDEAGQRTAIDAVQPLEGALADREETYTYNIGEEILDRTGWSYTHDTRGNLKTAVSGTSNQAYTYDPDSRMTDVLRDGVSDLYDYDGDGNRVRAVRGTEETRYLLDRNASLASSLAEIDDTETVTRYDIHGHRLLWSLDGAGNRFVYHTDPVGSVVAVTDDAAAILAAYAYDEFGTLIAESGSYGNDNRFVGSMGVTEEPSGLNFMRARYYDSLAGRFLTVDPFTSAYPDTQQESPYIYARQSPTTRVDPSGRSWELVKRIWGGFKSLITGTDTFEFTTSMDDAIAEGKATALSNLTTADLEGDFDLDAWNRQRTTALRGGHINVSRSGADVALIPYKALPGAGEAYMAAEATEPGFWQRIKNFFFPKAEAKEVTPEVMPVSKDRELTPEEQEQLLALLDQLVEVLRRSQGDENNSNDFSEFETDLRGICVKCPAAGGAQ
jgi:RHS repeat-associated protein